MWLSHGYGIAIYHWSGTRDQPLRPARSELGEIMKKALIGTVCLGLVVGATVAQLNAHQSSGAIFTTLPDGTAVNFNIYDAKTDVYLDGGPGQHAPQTAAGLDDGTYVFQVTDPSGKTLLSQDIGACRQVTVSGGVITASLKPATCATPHVTGLDVDWAATTVQLMPYADTPNNGGEYKAWMTYLDDYLAACALNGQDGLAVVDCGLGQRGNFHGFFGRHSKTDNFKVGGTPKEIDTRFHDGALGGPFIDGLAVTWTDTLDASNRKWSHWDPDHMVFHEAHVENVELGTHKITIENQLGCKVGTVALAGKKLAKSGPQTVAVSVTNGFKGDTIFLDVACID
jgi:hypothetical protein